MTGQKNKNGYGKNLKMTGFAALGLLLALSGIFVTGETYSSFSSSASENSQARVAAFVVDVELDQAKSKREATIDLSGDLSGGQTEAEWSFTVSNTDDSGKTSEVAWKYDIIVRFPESNQDVLSALTVTVDGKSAAKSGANEFWLTDEKWKFPSSGNKQSHTLTITADPAQIQELSTDTASAAGTISDSKLNSININNIEILVHAEQID